MNFVPVKPLVGFAHAGLSTDRSKPSKRAMGLGEGGGEGKNGQ